MVKKRLTDKQTLQLIRDVYAWLIEPPELMLNVGQLCVSLTQVCEVLKKLEPGI